MANRVYTSALNKRMNSIAQSPVFEPRGRIDSAKTAEILGFQEHDIPVLVAHDEGDDLLLLNRETRASCTVQVKVSRDYLMTHMDEIFHPLLECSGWFTPTRSKIAKSQSDYWIIGLHSYGHHRLSLLILKPEELLRRYDRIHGRIDRLQSYFSLTKEDNRVFETRGLSRDKMHRLFMDDEAPDPPERDFTEFLNDWSGIKSKLGIN